MNTILLVCIPVALGAGLLWGFAIGRMMPRAESFSTPEEHAAKLAQETWEEHWAATRDSEIKPNADGDLTTVWTNVAHTHVEP